MFHKLIKKKKNCCLKEVEDVEGAVEGGEELLERVQVLREGEGADEVGGGPLGDDPGDELDEVVPGAAAALERADLSVALNR